MFAPSNHELRHSSPAASRGAVVLLIVWSALGAYVFISLARGLSLRDDVVSLPGVAFFALTAVLGSRVWLAASQRLSRHSEAH